MTPRQLHRLLVAPETLSVDVADAALLALDRALRFEHPAVDIDSTSDPELRRRAREVLHPIPRLRRALRAYRRALERHLSDLHGDDRPF